MYLAGTATCTRILPPTCIFILAFAHHFSLSFTHTQTHTWPLHLNKRQNIQMKKLIRRLSRVADSSPYSLLRSESRSSPTAAAPRLCQSFRLAKPRRSATVPEGHLPVYVGEEMERFVVSADLLNHPIFINLLNKSAQEYGYEQKGVLRIPCHVLVFERVLEALRAGKEASHNLQDLISDEFL